MHEFRINITRATRGFSSQSTADGWLKLWPHGPDSPIAYKHFFQVILGANGDSSGNKDNVLTILHDLAQRYPAPEFKVSISKRSIAWRCRDSVADHTLAEMRDFIEGP